LKLLFFKACLLFSFLINISLSQKITPEISKLENKIFQLDNFIDNSCYADIDKEIDQLLIETEKINHTLGGAFLTLFKANRYIAQNKEELVYELIEENEKKINQSINYGIIDKWFYYKFIDLSLRNLTEGIVSTENELLNILDKDEIKNSPEKLLYIYFILWSSNKELEKKELYYQKLRDVIDSNKDLSKTYIFANITFRSIINNIHYINIGRDNNIYNIDLNDIKLSKKTLKRLDLDKTIEMDALESLENLYLFTKTFEQNRNLSTFDKGVDLYQEVTKKNLLQFVDESVLFLFISKVYELTEKYDQGNLFLLTENKKWENLWNDQYECLKNTTSNDIILNLTNIQLDVNQVRASFSAGAYRQVANNYYYKGDDKNYKKYLLMAFEQHKILDSKNDVFDIAMELARLYYQDYHNQDVEKFLRIAQRNLNYFSGQELIDYSLIYAGEIYNLSKSHQKDRIISNTLDNVYSLIIENKDHKNEYYYYMQKSLIPSLREDETIYLKKADSLLTNYEFERDILLYDTFLNTYYKDLKKYDRLRKINVDRYEYLVSNGKIVDAIDKAADDYYTFIAIYTESDSDYETLDSMIANIEEMDITDNTRTWIKLKKLGYFPFRLKSFSEEKILDIINSYIDLKDEVYEVDNYIIDADYLQIAISLSRPLNTIIKSTNSKNIKKSYQKMLSIYEQHFWKSINNSRIGDFDKFSYLEMYNGNVGEFNETKYFKAYKELISNRKAMEFDIHNKFELEIKIKHASILENLKRFDEAIATLEKTIFDARKVGLQQYELDALVKLQDIHQGINQDQLFLQRNMQAIKLAEQIKDTTEHYLLLSDRLDDFPLDDKEYESLVLKYYELGKAIEAYDFPINKIIKYYAYKEDFDSFVKYAIEAIDNKSNFRTGAYIDFLYELFLIADGSTFKKFTSDIITILSGQGSSSSSQINKIANEFIYFKNFDYKSVDFYKAPFIYTNGWNKSIELQRIFDKKYLSYDDWYWIIDKFSNLENFRSINRRWALSNSLIAINFRIEAIENYPLSSSYKGYGFQYNESDNNFYVTNVFKGPALNKLKIGDQIIVPEDVKSLNDFSKWLSVQVDKNKSFKISIIRNNENPKTFELVAAELQPNPYTKDPEQEIKKLLLDYNRIKTSLDATAPKYSKKELRLYKSYLAYYPWRYWYSNGRIGEISTPSVNLDFLSKYENATAQDFINQSLFHKKSINNNPILFDEYNRISVNINTIQRDLQNSQLSSIEVKELLNKRNLAYQDLIFFENYNLEKINVSTEKFSFEKDIRLFEKFDRVVKYCSAPPSLNYALAWSKDSGVFQGSYTTDEEKLSVLVKSLEKTLRYDVENPSEDSNLENELIKLTESITGGGIRPFKKENIDNDNLLVATEGSLKFFPFELLLIKLESDTNKYHYYGEFVNITYTPSLSAYSKLYKQKGNKTTNKALLISSNPNSGNTENYLNNLLSFRSNLGNIKYVDNEVDNIDRTLSSRKGRKKGIKTTVLKSTDISEKNFKNLNLSDYKYIHLATHGVHDTENPQYSGLLLGREKNDDEDGILQSHEIFPLKLNADLVTLSSCFSGFGELDKAEGNIGFYRTFLIAGAKSVIISLWDVEDQSTSILFSKFYELLRSGKSKSESLRLAKMYLKNETKFSHPFFWAPFILIGES
tara:strand:+ start:81 stop:5045 length:4965 start_codon:yes stop_codon:yes gene_type:complete